MDLSQFRFINETGQTLEGKYSGFPKVPGNPILRMIKVTTFLRAFCEFDILALHCFQTTNRLCAIALVSCIILMKKLVSLTMVAIESGTKRLFSYIATAAKRKKMLYQKREFCRYKLPLEIELIGKYHAKQNVTTTKF